MFPTWRLRLREARVACQNGRYDEAGAMLADEKLREFLPAKQLAHDVADKMLERAGNRFALGDSAAGWKDLQRSRSTRRQGRSGQQNSPQLRRRNRSATCDAIWPPANRRRPSRVWKSFASAASTDEHVRTCQQIAAADAGVRQAGPLAAILPRRLPPSIGPRPSPASSARNRV